MLFDMTSIFVNWIKQVLFKEMFNQYLDILAKLQTLILKKESEIKDLI